MTPDEAERVIAELIAFWPRPEMTEDQIMAWRKTLASLVFDDALATVERLSVARGKQADWMPSHSAFFWACTERRSSTLAAPYHAPFPALPARNDKLPPEESRRRFDAMRALLPQNRNGR